MDAVERIYRLQNRLEKLERTLQALRDWAVMSPQEFAGVWRMEDKVLAAMVTNTLAMSQGTAEERRSAMSKAERRTCMTCTFWRALGGVEHAEWAFCTRCPPVTDVFEPRRHREGVCQEHQTDGEFDADRRRAAFGPREEVGNVIES